MPDNTKAAGDTRANYNFACIVDFTRDRVYEITTKDEKYRVEEIDFVGKDIDTYCHISFTLPDNTRAADDISAN